ncbi:hypothetical protein BOTBODRAFT_31046 [Botryobasidium botryosum FD-172 SS1]|uniref:DFDF domain-containing protein n=1 Tax=Botryobasidium botryosum (strain FD-172 SS1) TaxID=930990 RepID=A0A067MLG3_BOTB1|nr:hypothetical protein BOTBODRAFT_31046 [Botryobasidium botryosum FD-172 SS1]
MGTENRRPANEYIPPNETPYEFIIFRATEVKDLAVDQPPPQQAVTAQRSVHDDPAVIGASSLPAQGYNNYGGMPPQPVNPYQTPQPVAAAPPPAVQEPAPVPATNGKQRASENSSTAASPAAPVAANNATATPAAPVPTTAAGTSARANRPRDNRRADSSPVRSASASLEKVERAIGDLRLSNANAAAGAHGGRHNRRGNNSNPRSGGGGGAGARTGGAAVVPNVDFDFARSNAKFDKAAAAAALGGNGAAGNTDSASGASSPEQPKSPAAPEKTQFYDRTRSFFDDISSDSKAKTQGGPGQGPGGRNRREEERSKNLSTFGEAGGNSVYWPGAARDGGSGWRGGRRRKWNGGGGGRQQQQQSQAAAQQ